jgi:hypothetical protein
VTKAFFLCQKRSTTWSAADSRETEKHLDELVANYFSKLDNELQNNKNRMELWQRFFNEYDSQFGNFAPSIDSMITASAAGQKVAQKIENGSISKADFLNYKLDILKSSYINLFEYLAIRYLLDESDHSLPSVSVADIGLNAKVAGSSPPYPGFGIENALDGDPYNDYAAMLEGAMPQGFLLDLNRNALIYSIEIEFADQKHYAVDFTLDSVDDDKNFIDAEPINNLATVKDNDKNVWSKVFNPPVSAAYLRFMTTSAAGQPRLLMRQIKVLAFSNMN